MDKEQNTMLGVITSAVVGAAVYPDAEDILKIILPLIAGAIAPTVKDFFADIADYFREKILKLKPRKKDIQEPKETDKNFTDAANEI